MTPPSVNHTFDESMSSMLFSPPTSQSFHDPQSSVSTSSAVNCSSILLTSGPNIPSSPSLDFPPMFNSAPVPPFPFTTPISASPLAEDTIPIATKASGSNISYLQGLESISSQMTPRPISDIQSPGQQPILQSGLMITNGPFFPILEPLKKTHFCPWPNCNKTFTRSAHLARHARSHGGEKPYICPQEGCGKQFSRSDVLKEHNRIHDVNKVRKRKARNSGGRSKSGDVKTNNANSAVAAVAATVALQQNAIQPPATPPPLAHCAPDGVSMSPNAVFPSLLYTNVQNLSPVHPSAHLFNSGEPQQFSYQPQYSPQGQYQQAQPYLLTQGFTFGTQHQGIPGTTLTPPTQNQFNHGQGLPGEINIEQPGYSSGTLNHSSMLSSHPNGFMEMNTKDPHNSVQVNTLPNSANNFSVASYANNPQPSSSIAYMSMNMNSASSGMSSGLAHPQDLPFSPHPVEQQPLQQSFEPQQQRSAG
ncbi:hypothetical protein BGX21_004897, partial [Mortierella sp. AD011]